MTESDDMSQGSVIVSLMTPERLPDSLRLGGIVTTVELAAAGVTTAGLRAAVRRGTLVPMGRGVYARAAAASSLAATERGERALRLAAAVAAMGPGCAGSHQDAATVHGLALLDRQPADIVSVSRSPDLGGRRTGRAGIRLHIAALPPDHLTAAHKVPVTSVARTVIDVAPTTPFRSAVL